VKSHNSSQRNEALLVMAVGPGKKFGFQSAAENLQRRRQPDQLRQTVPDRCSSRWKGAVASGRTHSAWNYAVATVVGLVVMAAVRLAAAYYQCKLLAMASSESTLAVI